MTIGVDGKEKPVYNEGDFVEFEVGEMRGRGYIRGLAMEHVIDIIDMWIVEIVDVQNLPKTYPYSCLAIQHTLLKLAGIDE